MSRLSQFRQWLAIPWRDRRLICALRGHPQEIGYGYPTSGGGGLSTGMFLIRTEAPSVDIWRTSCRCHHKMIEMRDPPDEVT
jgi:hypothetical protein